MKVIIFLSHNAIESNDVTLVAEKDGLCIHPAIYDDGKHSIRQYYTITHVQSACSAVQNIYGLDSAKGIFLDLLAFPVSWLLSGPDLSKALDTADVREAFMKIRNSTKATSQIKNIESRLILL